MEIEIEEYDKYIFVGCREMDCMDSFGDNYGGIDIIVKNTNNFLKCIKKLRIQRDRDIKIHGKGDYVDPDFMNGNGGFEISYSVAVYKYKDCGVSFWLDIYQDIYNEICTSIDDTIKDDIIKYEIRSYIDELADIDKKYKKNIKKLITNCLQTDKKKLNWKGKGRFDKIGNIDYKFIKSLIKEQNYKCHKCGDNFVMFNAIPYCCYKISIDRIDNNQPHNKDNVKMSCYFCNCKDHIMYGKQEKIKCEDKKCFCNDYLFDMMDKILVQ